LTREKKGKMPEKWPHRGGKKKNQGHDGRENRTSLERGKCGFIQCKQHTKTLGNKMLTPGEGERAGKGLGKKSTVKKKSAPFNPRFRYKNEKRRRQVN